MTRLAMDPTASAKLKAVKDRVEICDENGHTLGQFVPLENRELYEDVEVPFTKEELDRFAREPGGRTLAEILADLERKSS